MTFDFERFADITASVYPQSVYSLQDALSVFRYYFEQYEKHMGKPHPPIRASQIVRISDMIPGICPEPFVSVLHTGIVTIISTIFSVGESGNCDFTKNFIERGERYERENITAQGRGRRTGACRHSEGIRIHYRARRFSVIWRGSRPCGIAGNPYRMQTLRTSPAFRVDGAGRKR